MKLAVVILAIALLLEGCEQAGVGDEAHTAAAADAAIAPQPSEVATAAPDAAQPDAADVLSAQGVTGAPVGSSWKDVAAAFEIKGAYAEVGGTCDVYDRLDGKLSAMVEDGTITRIEVREGGIRTADGIGIGSSLAALQEAYGNQLAAEENPYAGQDFFVWQSKDRGLVFHVEAGRVKFMAGGGESIRYVEGCL
ncbi:MAG: hypothetical protein Q8R81_17040 [Novosphingobium sp.]|uniref:hypothetical protein n=1 Tax=Novosphingobium sp. TaxID=1874826 RepID=UPI0027355667|nr:hypothetical protein [Novosphingobium sp.]MDP3552089.1 hypothetical protein [Novosphingobium sp.]